MASGEVAGTRVFRVNVGMRIALQQLQTGFYLRDVGVQARTSAEVVAEVKTWVDTKFATIMPSSLAFERLEATELNSKEYAQHEYTNFFGAKGGGVVTTFLAANVSLRTATRQRYRNGRMFWPVLVRDSITDGLINDLTMGEFGGVAADFADRWTGVSLFGELRAVVVTAARPAKTYRPALTHSWTDVEAVKINKIATAISRRRIGVGS